MKFVSLHTKNTSIVYKNSLCSSATIIVLVFLALSVMVPILLVSMLSPYSGIAESRILFEQPQIHFKYQHLFVAEMKEIVESKDSETSNDSPNLVVCSSFPNFNARMGTYVNQCEGTKYWSEDFDYDSVTDRVHFQVKLDSVPNKRIENLDMVLFFEAKLKHKCELKPPALLAHHLVIPSSVQMYSGTIHLKAEVQLKQYVEFACPFPGRNYRTHFRDVVLNSNTSRQLNDDDLEQFKLESLLRQLKVNPGYFQLDVQETYFRRDLIDGLRVQLDIDVLQVPGRYHLSVWERLGQFWLYFASFFGISFYIMNKIKDFLFGRHIIRSWEIIPWKKLY